MKQFASYGLHRRLPCLIISSILGSLGIIANLPSNIEYLLLHLLLYRPSLLDLDNLDVGHLNLLLLLVGHEVVLHLVYRYRTCGTCCM